MRVFLVVAMLVAPAYARPELAGNVLVWQDARLYLEPSDKAPSLQVATLDGKRQDHVGQVMAMRVVGTAGAFVEVTPVEDPGCVESTLAMAGVERAHLFVRRADLAPVVVKRWSHQLAEDARVTIEPGEPVVPAGDRYAVPLRSAVLQLAIPAGSFGLSYRPAPPQKQDVIELLRDRALYTIAANTRVVVGDQSFQIPEELYPPVTDRVDHPKPELAALPYRAGCVTLDVVVPAAAIQPWREPTLAGDGTLPELGERDEIPQGTPLSTRSGHVVGVAAWPLAVKRSDGEAIACTNVSALVAGRLQAVPASGSGPATSVELCAPASKVKHRKASRGWSGKGLGSFGAK